MFTRSAAYYDAIYAFKDYAKEASQLRDLIDRHKRSKGNDLLDVGCGTGKHLSYLRRQYHVEGLDIDSSILAVARRNNPGIRFHQADMVTFDLGRRYDAVTCLFSSIGYVRTEERLAQTVRNFAQHTRPGGVILVEAFFSPERWQTGHLAAAFVDSPDLKVARMNLSESDGNLGILNFHYLVGTPAGIDYFTERHELALFSDEDFRKAFDGAGLEVAYDPSALTGRGVYIGRLPLD